MTYESLTQAVTAFMEIVSTVVTTIGSNSLLLVFFSAGIIFTAIAAVKRLRG